MHDQSGERCGVRRTPRRHLNSEAAAPAGHVPQRGACDLLDLGEGEFGFFSVASSKALVNGDFEKRSPARSSWATAAVSRV